MSDEKISTGIYGAAAFLALGHLMAKLIERGVLSEGDKQDIWALTAGGLAPANDPGVQAMRALLQTLSGAGGSTQ